MYYVVTVEQVDLSKEKYGDQRTEIYSQIVDEVNIKQIIDAVNPILSPVVKSLSDEPIKTS